MASSLSLVAVPGPRNSVTLAEFIVVMSTGDREHNITRFDAFGNTVCVAASDTKIVTIGWLAPARQ